LFVDRFPLHVYGDAVYKGGAGTLCPSIACVGYLFMTIYKPLQFPTFALVYEHALYEMCSNVIGWM
jgi:hypothetical protein